MIAADSNCYEEDEDVVIAGSELHEALSKMGYMDYEVVSRSHSGMPNFTDTDRFAPKMRSIRRVIKVLRKKLEEIYRRMTEDSETKRQQLLTISEARHLLDDHAQSIQLNLLDENGVKEAGRLTKFSQYLPYAAVATFGYNCMANSHNRFFWFLTLPALIAARSQYTKRRSVRNLKNLISEQTELLHTYKRAMRILNHSFRMNNGAKHLGSNFTDIGSEKLKFLQPITEEMIRSFETMSVAYYETTLKMGELLPNLNDSITYFDREFLTTRGEVTYDYLKQQFYRFILIQSEMLLTVAVLRHNEPYGLFAKIKHGMKVDRCVEKLVELTSQHRKWMQKLVDDFKKHKLPVVKEKCRGFAGSKWQNLYVRLHLTSHKLGKAYDNITSVLEEIENHLDKGTDEAELVDLLKTKLNNVCDDTDKAKDLAQLNSLIVTKMWKARYNGDKEIDNKNVAGRISPKELAVVRDKDPVIIDEVFEEYIREQYCEVLLDGNCDDYLEGNYKLDKLLSKNLMSELKDALIDKQKDTKLRESRALKRMNKHPQIETPDDSTSDSEGEIEPDGLRKQATSLVESAKESSKNESESLEEKLNYIPMPPPPPLPKEFDQLRKELGKIVVEKEEKMWRPKNLDPLSGSSETPSLFLSNNEETFVGSGENSDVEVCDEETEK